MPGEAQSLKDSTNEFIGSSKYLAELISAGAGLVPIAIGLWGWWSNNYDPIPWFLGAFAVAGFLVVSLFIALNRVTTKYNALKNSIANDPELIASQNREAEVRRLRDFQSRLVELNGAISSHVMGHTVSAEQVVEYKNKTAALVRELDGFLECQDLTWFAALRPGGGMIAFGTELDGASDQISRAQFRLKERLIYLQNTK